MGEMEGGGGAEEVSHLHNGADGSVYGQLLKIDTKAGDLSVKVGEVPRLK